MGGRGRKGWKERGRGREGEGEREKSDVTIGENPSKYT